MCLRSGEGAMKLELTRNGEEEGLRGRPLSESCNDGRREESLGVDAVWNPKEGESAWTRRIQRLKELAAQ